VVFLEKPTPKNGLLFGLFCALSALTKPVVLLYPVVFGAWWLLWERGSGLRRPQRSPGAPARRLWVPARWAAVSAIFLAMAVVILPWTYRNYRTSGHPVLITTGAGDAFLRGYIFSKPDYALLRLSPYIYAENESNAAFREICREAGTVWGRNDIESDRILSKASKERLLADPGAFVRKVLVQLFTFWYEMTSRTTSLVAGISALLLWILALVGWRRARREGYVAWPLFVPILCLNISLAILLALGRYSIPVLPALAVLAAFGVDTLLSGRTLSMDAEAPRAPTA
jgi:hypothetical protein